MTTVTEAGRFRIAELTRADIPGLQRFFEANPEYFISVNGEPPRPVEAQEEIDTLPPPEFPHGARYLLKFVDPRGEIVAMANVLGDLFAPGIWHIGLFVLATRLHGSGVAMLMHAWLEMWMRDKGAKWIRLGVVEGNARAERFWEKAGYVDIRKRHGVEMGRRVNTLRVMAKPLAGGTVEEYLALVARDRPD